MTPRMVREERGQSPVWQRPLASRTPKVR
jgi:hypothetical protein